MMERMLSPQTSDDNETEEVVTTSPLTFTARQIYDTYSYKKNKDANSHKDTSNIQLVALADDTSTSSSSLRRLRLEQQHNFICTKEEIFAEIVQGRVTMSPATMHVLAGSVFEKLKTFCDNLHSDLRKHEHEAAEVILRGVLAFDQLVSHLHNKQDEFEWSPKQLATVEEEDEFGVELGAEDMEDSLVELLDKFFGAYDHVAISDQREEEELEAGLTRLVSVEGLRNAFAKVKKFFLSVSGESEEGQLEAADIIVGSVLAFGFLVDHIVEQVDEETIENNFVSFVRHIQDSEVTGDAIPLLSQTLTKVERFCLSAIVEADKKEIMTTSLILKSIFAFEKLIDHVQKIDPRATPEALRAEFETHFNLFDSVVVSDGNGTEGVIRLVSMSAMKRSIANLEEFCKSATADSDDDDESGGDLVEAAGIFIGSSLTFGGMIEYAHDGPDTTMEVTRKSDILSGEESAAKSLSTLDSLGKRDDKSLHKSVSTASTHFLGLSSGASKDKTLDTKGTRSHSNSNNTQGITATSQPSGSEKSQVPKAAEESEVSAHEKGASTPKATTETSQGEDRSIHSIHSIRPGQASPGVLKKVGHLLKNLSSLQRTHNNEKDKPPTKEMAIMITSGAVKAASDEKKNSTPEFPGVGALDVDSVHSELTHPSFYGSRGDSLGRSSFVRYQRSRLSSPRGKANCRKRRDDGSRDGTSSMGGSYRSQRSAPTAETPDSPSTATEVKMDPATNKMEGDYAMVEEASEGSCDDSNQTEDESSCSQGDDSDDELAHSVHTKSAETVITAESDAIELSLGTESSGGGEIVLEEFDCVELTLELCVCTPKEEEQEVKEPSIELSLPEEIRSPNGLSWVEKEGLIEKRTEENIVCTALEGADSEDTQSIEQSKLPDQKGDTRSVELSLHESGADAAEKSELAELSLDESGKQNNGDRTEPEKDEVLLENRVVELEKHEKEDCPPSEESSESTRATKEKTIDREAPNASKPVEASTNAQRGRLAKFSLGLGRQLSKMGSKQQRSKVMTSKE